MPKQPTKESTWPTPYGDLQIRSFCTAEEIRRFTLDSQFNTHTNYKSLFTRRESLETIADTDGANVVLATTAANLIVGLGVLAYPEQQERWSQLGSKIMIEVSAIEVARSWRSANIASRILETLTEHPQIEDKIIYMVGYSWTWDLEDTNKTARAYRNLLKRLFESCGFQEYQTNEPNISLKPENLFMCRIGNNISEAILNRFKWLRFGLTPWTWTQ
jgi:acetoin utilization protein AcuA